MTLKVEELEHWCCHWDVLPDTHQWRLLPTGREPDSRDSQACSQLTPNGLVVDKYSVIQVCISAGCLTLSSMPVKDLCSSGVLCGFRFHFYFSQSSFLLITSCELVLAFLHSCNKDRDNADISCLGQGEAEYRADAEPGNFSVREYDSPTLPLFATVRQLNSIFIIIWGSSNNSRFQRCLWLALIHRSFLLGTAASLFAKYHLWTCCCLPREIFHV